MAPTGYKGGYLSVKINAKMHSKHYLLSLRINTFWKKNLTDKGFGQSVLKLSKFIYCFIFWLYVNMLKQSWIQ